MQDKNKCLTLNFIKMKNLENYGVQEMKKKEIRDVDGGRLPSTLESSFYITGSVVHAIGDFLSGAIDRFNKYRN